MYFKLFGASDNYNTEYTERLHIDLAKDAYRSTNFKDTFPQMTLWLERKEKNISPREIHSVATRWLPRAAKAGGASPWHHVRAAYQDDEVSDAEGRSN
jgi:hypothetical protein